MKRLTQQEEKAMRRLWKLGDGTVKDILSLYPDPPPLYTTLASVVKNIERKGYVKARRVGSAYLYMPLVSRDDYKRASMARMVEHYFGNSYRDLVSFFVKDRKISTDTLKDIIALIEKEE